MIALGTLVRVPRYGVGRVFGNYGSRVWVEIEATKQHVAVEEELVVPPEEPPTEEEVAYG